MTMYTIVSTPQISERFMIERFYIRNLLKFKQAMLKRGK